MATKKFRCKVCGYVHEGDKAPATCPVCNAPASEFEASGIISKDQSAAPRNLHLNCSRVRGPQAAFPTPRTFHATRNSVPSESGSK